MELEYFQKDSVVNTSNYSSTACRIAGRYIEHEYESCFESDMLPSNRRLLIRKYVTTVLLA